MTTENNKYIMTRTIHRKKDSPIIYNDKIDVSLYEENKSYFLILTQYDESICCDLEQLRLAYEASKLMIEEAECKG